jgi:F-type H+-transporting ATPase subunit delta
LIVDPAAKRYAEAAYLIAREDGTQDAWVSGLKALASLTGDPDAQRFFEDSRVPIEHKRGLIEKALDGADPNVLKLALLLLRRRRMGLGPMIADAYQEILDREKGIAHAVVTSAVPLSPGEQEAVQRKLVDITGGPVVVRQDVDESIIGGLVVRMGDRLIDGSTRSRLLALKQRLSGARS